MSWDGVMEWLKEGARNVATAPLGNPGTPWGEVTRAGLAAIRAPLNGTEYATERQRIRSDEGQSAVPDVAMAQALEQMREQLPFEGFTAGPVRMARPKALPVRQGGAIAGGGRFNKTAEMVSHKGKPALFPIAVHETDNWIIVREGGPGGGSTIFSAPLVGGMTEKMGLSADQVRRDAYQQALHARLRSIRNIEQSRGRLGPLNFRDMEFPDSADPDFIVKAQAALARGLPGGEP